MHGFHAKMDEYICAYICVCVLLINLLTLEFVRELSGSSTLEYFQILNTEQIKSMIL